MSNNLVPRYQVGELLDLRVPRVRYADERPGYRVLVGEGLNGEPFEIQLPYGATGYQLERVAPPEWPPVAGDIWGDRFASEWMALEAGDADTSVIQLRMADDDTGKPMGPDEVAARYGPMRLVRRRDWSPTPPTTEPEPEPYRVTTDAERRAELITGLRKLLDLVEARPDLPFSPSYLLFGAHTMEGLRAWSEATGKPITEDADDDDTHFAVACPELAMRTYVIEEHAPAPEPASAEPVDEPIAEPAPAEQPQDWWFTFGHGQVDKNGFSLTDHYVVLHGTYDTARARMVELFGSNWSFQYASAELAGVDRFLLKPLPVGVLDEAASAAPDKPAPIAAHYEVAGWKGEGDDGKCGVECACGLTFDGFDTLADAADALNKHIEAAQ